MNRKSNPKEVLSQRATLRYTVDEYNQVKMKAENAGKSFSTYCREMTIYGHVFAVLSPVDLNSIREFKVLLIEQKTHFNRISNLIKSRDPSLLGQVQSLANQMQEIINKMKL